MPLIICCLRAAMIQRIPGSGLQATLLLDALDTPLPAQLDYLPRHMPCFRHAAPPR